MSNIVEIKLTRGYVAIVDAVDADLGDMKWEAHIGHTGRVYARRGVHVNGKKKWIWMHRVILTRKLGVLFLLDDVPDHVDNNPLNNRRSNLRIASRSENLFNSRNQQRQQEKGRLKGAHYHIRDKKWTSSIIVDKHQIHLGTFKTMEEAHDAYCKAAEQRNEVFKRAA